MVNLRLIAVGALLAGFCGTPLALADLVEQIKDQMQISKGKKWLKRDQVEVEEFQALVGKFQLARESGEQTFLQTARGEVSGAMQRELEQSMEKLEQAKKEAGASSFEVIGQRIEVEKNKKRVEDGREGAKIDSILDALAHADDKKDRDDDIEDAKAIGGRAKRQGEILATFAAADLGAKEDDTLLAEFQGILAADIVATEEEIKEDKKELSEDRAQADRNRKKKKK